MARSRASQGDRSVPGIAFSAATSNTTLIAKPNTITIMAFGGATASSKVPRTSSGRAAVITKYHHSMPRSTNGLLSGQLIIIPSNSTGGISVGATSHGETRNTRITPTAIATSATIRATSHIRCVCVANLDMHRHRPIYEAPNPVRKTPRLQQPLKSARRATPAPSHFRLPPTPLDARSRHTCGPAPRMFLLVGPLPQSLGAFPRNAHAPADSLRALLHLRS